MTDDTEASRNAPDGASRWLLPPRPPQRVRAIRGAITVEHDTPDELREATCDMLLHICTRNGIVTDDIVSAIFTLTPDLRSDSPARGARTLPGWGAVPMLCATEVDVPGALARCIRVMLQAYTDRPASELVHAYLREARILRPDLHAQE